MSWLFQLSHMLLVQRRRETYLLCKEIDRLLFSQREWKLEQSFCGNHAIHINEPESKHMFSFWKFIITNYWKGPNLQTIVSFTRMPPWIAWIWIHKCLKWTGYSGMQGICAASVHLIGMALNWLQPAYLWISAKTKWNYSRWARTSDSLIPGRTA